MIAHGQLRENTYLSVSRIDKILSHIVKHQAFHFGDLRREGQSRPTSKKETLMRKFMFALAVLAGVATMVGTALAESAGAQQKSIKEQLVGTWVQVSNITTRADGTKVETWGPDAKSIMILQSDGRVATIITRADLPKFASNNRATGTADENKAVVQGSLAYFGTYSVDEANKKLSMYLEASTFSNWAGTTQTRDIALSGDELTQSVSAASAGGTSEIKYKRAK
jgi:hypothetical protein